MALTWWLNNQIPEVLTLGASESVIAFCGAGGKSSAIARLAAQLRKGQRKVILSTTTHVYANHLGSDIPNVIRETFDHYLDFKTHSIGLYSEISPVGKLSCSQLSEKMACINNLSPLWLIEADGARHGHVKAPLAHEPCWPSAVDLAVGCFSAQILGCRFEEASVKPLTFGGVHRPEQFAAITEICEGQTIDEMVISKLIGHEAGMFRGLKADCRRVVLATQVKAEQLPALKRLSECIAHPLVLVPFGQPVPEPVALRPYPYKLAAAVMAGGKSQRMGSGSNKLFMKLSGGASLLEVTLMTPLKLKAAGFLEEVVLVSGHQEAYLTALNQGISFIDNPSADKGLSEGLKRLARYGRDPSLEAVFICMGDQPLVDDSLFKDLARALLDKPKAQAAIPTFEGIRMSPVLVRRSFLEQFEALSGDKGAKALLETAQCVLCPQEKPEVFRDVDTIEDFHWLEAWMRRAEGV